MIQKLDFIRNAGLYRTFDWGTLPEPCVAYKRLDAASTIPNVLAGTTIDPPSPVESDPSSLL